MKTIVDLHIHSGHARACSKDISIENLEKFAKIKGLNLLGTGDFCHPKWIEELKSKLTDDGTGILRTKTGFPFIFQFEISLMYSDGGKGRRIHNLVLAPNLGVVNQITEALLKKGRVDYDGRPIFGIPCPDFVEMMRSISPDIEVIPAHSWTPHFGVFGEKTGFNSLEECFKDQAKHVHAIESGISSDPAMNSRLSQLDKINVVSFSDIHSFWPWRLGREATILDIKELTYKNILNSLRTGEGLTGTIEADPSYGKYHIDGHRFCGVALDPKESQKLGEVCPKCGKKLTIGVLSRVEELADRPEGFVLKSRPAFRSVIPLSEIICFSLGSDNPASRNSWEIYNKLIAAFGSEFNVVLDASLEDLSKVIDPRIAKNIIDIRGGKVKILAGFDGVYGVPVFNPEEEEKMNSIRMKLVERERRSVAKKELENSAKESDTKRSSGKVKKLAEKKQKSLVEFK